jgi:phospholipase/carboxylesterase
MLHDQVITPLNDGKPTSAVILLHGLGDSGDGLLDLGHAWQRGLPDTEFLAPNAPFPCDMAPFGYQWFSTQDWTPEVVLAGVKKAAPYLDAYIDQVLATRDLAPERIALAGFSQGSMMALYVALRRAPSLAGVLAYSGALIGGEMLRKEKKSSPPVLLVHGMLDEVVPFPAMAKAYSGLQDVNINVESLARPDLSHSIDDVGLMEGLRFLRKILI